MTKTVLVTGASSGIGAGIVRAFTAEGHRVHALARRADRLTALANETGCTVHGLDVTDAAALEEAMGAMAPDVLVLNAGRGAGFVGLAKTDRADLVATIQTNVIALLDMVRLAIPGMTE